MRALRRSSLTPWKPSGANPWNASAAGQLLRRAGFGARPDELTRALNEGPARTLERLSEAPADLDESLGGIHALLGVGKLEHLQAWWMSLITGEGVPLVERATLMWHDHFATSNDKVDDVRMMHAQNETLREHALGDFRELLRRLAKDPAMLVWLDGDANKRGNPNENFAREVMELFAHGIGNYTEHDLQEAARAFTGWGTLGRSFAFSPDHHDRAEKTLFGQRGSFDGEQALELVLEHPACPAHVARRLLATFVDDQPELEVIDELAAVLVERDWNIGATLEVLLSSELFFAPRQRRGRITGPVEIVAMTARTLGRQVSPKRMALAAEHMGQSLFRPPSVKGWDSGRGWINAGTWLARHNELAGYVLDSSGRPRDGIEELFPSELRSLAPAERVLRTLFPDGVAPDYARVLQRAADAASSEAHALAEVTALALSSPEYHLV